MTTRRGSVSGPVWISAGALVGVIILAVLTLVLGHSGADRSKRDRILRVLCTTYPVYQFTRNLVGDRPGVTVSLLLPAQAGCPHDHTVTPEDLRRLAEADVLVMNGLGMEEFIDDAVSRVNPTLRRIDATAGITEIIADTDDEVADHAHRHRHDHAGASASPNPHCFTSPRLALAMAQTISDGLVAVDPVGAAAYRLAFATYRQRLEGLIAEVEVVQDALVGKRVVQSHGAFDYLARDLGLEIVGTTLPHGREPAAAQLRELVDAIRAQQVVAIIVEPQFPDRIGRTLSTETGVPVVALDPAASGPADAPPDHYETTMRANLTVLMAILEPR